MAYKDEYEVARLYTDGAFAEPGEERVRRRQSTLRISSRAADSGAARSGDRPAAQDELRSMADAGVPRAGEAEIPARHRARSVRPHARAPQTERKLIGDYETMLDEVLARLTPENHHLAVGSCRHSGEDPRLRPRQAASSHRRQGRRSGFVRAIPRRRARPAQGGGIARRSRSMIFENRFQFRDYAQTPWVCSTTWQALLSFGRFSAGTPARASGPGSRLCKTDARRDRRRLRLFRLCGPTWFCAHAADESNKAMTRVTLRTMLFPVGGFKRRDAIYRQPIEAKLRLVFRTAMTEVLQACKRRPRRLWSGYGRGRSGVYGRAIGGLGDG